MNKLTLRTSDNREVTIHTDHPDDLGIWIEYQGKISFLTATELLELVTKESVVVANPAQTAEVS